MSIFIKPVSLRWADLDPNFHVRHSVYYDLGSQHRIEILDSLGLTGSVMQKHKFGPVLFREECIFRREMRLEDTIFLHTSLQALREDGGRWTIRHEFVKNEEVLCAVLTLDGAWMDIEKRKLADPTPEIAFKVLSQIPRSAAVSGI